MVHGLRKLTDEQVLEIVELLEQGYKQAVIARMYDVHRTTIFNIKNGYRYGKLTKLGEDDYERDY